MNKKTIDRLEHRLCTELDEIAEREKLTPGDLDVIDKATHSLKSMAAIKANDNGQGYSQTGYPMANGGNWTAQGEYSRAAYRDGMMMDGGRRYAERRDSMGRYSNADGPDEMREQLRQMIDSGRLDQHQREAASKLMDALIK